MPRQKLPGDGARRTDFELAPTLATASWPRRWGLLWPGRLAPDDHAKDDTFGVANRRSEGDNSNKVVVGVELQSLNRLMRLRHYINQNLDKDLDRKVLATVSGVSVSHLHWVFRDGYGESLACYVRRVRMVRAAQKLRMGAVDISEVALAAGYHTHAAFGKAFKQQFGISPREFRQLDCRTATRMLRQE